MFDPTSYPKEQTELVGYARLDNDTLELIEFHGVGFVVEPD